MTTVRYELEASLDLAGGSLSGAARITVKNVSTRDLGKVPFLLYRLMELEGASDGSGHPLRVDQRVVRFEDLPALQVTRARVALARALRPGETAMVAVRWSGVLLGYAETGMAYVKDRIDPEFTILRNDSWAFPLPGVPSPHALRAAPSDSFDFLLRLTVPDGYVVANGGRLVSKRSAGGRTTFTYESLAPSSRIDVSVARFGLLTDGPIRVFHLPGDEEGARRVRDGARAALALYLGLLGPLPHERPLTFLEIPDGWGSQKDVTTILQTAAAFRDPSRLHEVYHEVAHLWDAEPLDRPSPRWNEGLATFLEGLAQERIGGGPVVDARAGKDLEYLKAKLSSHPEWREIPLVRYGEKGMTDLSYGVGSLFFYLAFRTAGENGLFSGLRSFYTAFSASGATTADLVRTLDALPGGPEWSASAPPGSPGRAG